MTRKAEAARHLAAGTPGDHPHAQSAGDPTARLVPPHPRAAGRRRHRRKSGNGGQRGIAPAFGLGEHQILTIERPLLEPEALLHRATTADRFDAAFFHTDFWFMCCTTFAFQP